MGLLTSFPVFLPAMMGLDREIDLWNGIRFSVLGIKRGIDCLRQFH